MRQKTLSIQLLFIFLLIAGASCAQRLFWLWPSQGMDPLTRSYLYVNQKVKLFLFDSVEVDYPQVALWSPTIRISQLSKREYCFYNNKKDQDCHTIYLVNKITGQRLDSACLATAYYPFYFMVSEVCYYDECPLFSEYMFHDIYFRGPELVNKVKVLQLDIEVVDTNKTKVYAVHLDSSQIPDPIRDKLKQVYTDACFITFRNIVLQDGDNRLFISEYINNRPGDLSQNYTRFARYQAVGWRNFHYLVPFK